MELKQNRLSDRRHFKLEDDGVWFRIRTTTEKVESKFRYEDLGLSTMTARKDTGSWIFAILTLIGGYALKFGLEGYEPRNKIDLLFIIFSAVLVFGSFVFLIIETRKTLIGITDGAKTFSLLRHTPSTQEVDEFIQELQRRIRKKIVEINVRPNDPNIDMDFKVSQLQYLLDVGTINQEMFDQVKNTLDPKTKREIGYKKQSDEGSP